MAILTWDDTGTREFETGVSQGVVFTNQVKDAHNIVRRWTGGKAWNGLISITESPSGAEPTAFYADDIKYGILRSMEDFSFTIEAYSYPKEFGECLGHAEIMPGLYVTGQPKIPFALAYKSKIGDDEHPGVDKGYKLHIIYNATANPSERQYQTINDSPDAITMSWECKTIGTKTGPDPYRPSPSVFPNHPPEMENVSHLVLDSRYFSQALMNAVESLIEFGDLPSANTLLYTVLNT